jgi:excisionase family DNA binding protein
MAKRRLPRVRRIFPVSLSVAETAVATGLNVRTVKQHIAENRLPAYKAKGRRRLVLVADIVEFIRKFLERV